MKKTRARFLSLLLTVCMVMSLLPTVAFATEGGTTIGASSLCEHHEHTEDCYTDELTCDIVRDSGEPEATENNATHIHGAECYESTLDCKFVCEDCAAVPSDKQMRSAVPTGKNIALAETSGGGLTTAADLKAALESTTPAAIQVAADITMSAVGINVGADHTLNIAEGKTVLTDAGTLTIPDGKTLTLAGTGTLNANPATGGIGIMVVGTLNLRSGSKLSATNAADGSVGIHLDSSGSLISEGGSITVSNIYGDGISAVDGARMILNSSNVIVENSGINSKGIYVPDLSLTGSTVNIVNTAGTGIEVVGGTMTIDNSTVSIDIGGDTGILIDYATLIGANGGKLNLHQGAKLKVGASVLMDGAYIYPNNNVVTVAAASDTPANNKVTAGEYIWDGTYFHKEAVAAPAYTISGTVSDANGGLADSLVQLYDYRGATVGSSVTTDSNGDYTISNVGNGTSYAITVSKAGYKTGYFNYFDVTDANVTGKDITLQPLGTASYLLKLGATEIDADSATQINGEGYSYLYDADTYSGTLTLYGYTNNTIGTTTDSDDYVVQSALFANFPLTIVLQGENNLHSSNTTDAESAGIYMDNAPLTIRGSGTLYAFADDAAGNDSSSYGIYAQELTVEGGTTHAQNGNSDIAMGAIDCGDITVTGGTVSATGMVVGISCANLTVSDTGNIEGRSRTEVGIEATGTLTVSGEAIVSGVSGANRNSIGIDAKAITLSDNGIIVGTGGTADGDGAGSYGVYVNSGTVRVTGGQLQGTGGNTTGTDGESYGVYFVVSGTSSISGSGEILGIAGQGTGTSVGISLKSKETNAMNLVSLNRDGSDLIEIPADKEITDYPYAIQYIPVATGFAFYRDGVKLEAQSNSIKIPAESSSTVRYLYKDLDQFGMAMDTAVGWVQEGTLPSDVTVGTANSYGIPVTVPKGASTGSFDLLAKKDGKTLGTLTVNIVDKVDVSNDITFTGGTATYTGNALSHETAVFNGTENGTGTFTYTYTVVGGTTGDLNADGKPVGAGMYSVDAVYEDDTQRGEECAFLTVIKATPVITGVSVENTPIYTTSVVILSHTDSNSGILAFDYGQILTVGTKDYNWTFTPTNTEDYNNVTGTVSITVVEDDIVSLAVTTPPAKTTYQHGETLELTGLVLTAALTSGSTVRVGYNDMSVTYQNGTAFQAGDTAVTLGYGGMTATQAVTVNKAEYTGLKTATGFVLTTGEVAEMTLPNLPDGASYGAPTDGGGTITMTDMTLIGTTTIVYTASASTAGQTGTITIPVTGGSYYNDYSVTVTVTSTDKQLQNISYAVGSVNKTYGEIYTNELTKTTVDGEITYASSNTSVATVNRNTGEVTLKGVGSATITATAAETATHAQATAIYSITVAKKDMVVRPSSGSIESNQSMPIFGWEIEGRLPNDILNPTNPDAIAMEAQENGVPLTTVKVGVFDIVFTTEPTFGETVTKNYNITIGTGTLTVTQYSSGGGGSTGGGSNTTVTTPPATTENPNPPTQVTATVKPTVSGDTVSANVSEKAVDNAIAKAQAEAKKNGTTDNGIVVELKVDTQNTKAENISTSLPKGSVDALVRAEVTELRITSGIVKISLNLDALKEIQKQLGSDISVTAKKIDNSTLSAEAKKIVGDRPVYDLSITGNNGKKVTDFGDGKVSVSIPYTLKPGENPANVVAYYIDSSGKVQEMPNSVYDPATKTLSFVTDHFSKFAVGYKSVNVSFTDITNHWANESIEFVAARGLLNGTGEGKFSPDISMTRGMFVTALGRLAGADVISYKTSSFTDVKAGSYYLGYIEWASKNGIVNGTGDGKFAPDQAISREQMAVIMANYAKAIGFELPKVHAENIFADNAKIGSYANDAVKQMQMAGILAGKNGNQFDPQGTATRAEVSAVLKRFVELAINSDTAQGWTLNDSGK
ncbi:MULTISPECIES: S-layer homology domain-containing protein [unclassified Sedimentibacter]|uniref:S-layer homology domain-containing protein n=1 Tax=unclassified Sedimentibacter TaxID=2649220 RepID=UPI0027DF7007|nr:S-layer homology domain-containing protein [Sedimentibacter sp. MB35-C1]WMJ78688.1 S-layer homology domain-containing protein [Sedimentibacter sp. MB35-C1]